MKNKKRYFYIGFPILGMIFYLVYIRCSAIDMVYSDYTVIDVSDSIIGSEIAAEPDKIITGNVCGASFMYTKRIAEKVGNYDPDLFLAEDYDYWLRIYANGKMFHLKDENLYYYRIHSESLTETKQSRIAAHLEHIKRILM